MLDSTTHSLLSLYHINDYQVIEFAIACKYFVKSTIFKNFPLNFILSERLLDHSKN